MGTHACRITLCLLTLLVTPLVQASYELRLLVQSSQLADPSRREAVSLMLHLLPLGGRAGVWAFGQEVEQLAPLAEVTPQWRDQALAAVQKADISEGGAALPAALEQVAGAGTPAPDLPRGLLLFADGRVRVADSPMVNAAAARTLLEEVATGSAGETWPIFTALEEGAVDLDLLQGLARASGGQGLPARSTPAATWLEVLQAALPMTRLPRRDNAVAVPEGAAELSWLIEVGRPEVQIQPPGEPTESTATRVRFANYRLRRWSAPPAGDWQVAGRDAGHVTAYAATGLSPAARALPTRLRAGQALQGSFQLLDQRQGQGPSETMQWQALLEGPGGLVITRTLAPATGTTGIPVEFPALETPGWYRLDLTAERGGDRFAWQYRLVVEAATAGSSISTRPPELPEANLRNAAASLAVIVAVLGLSVAWVLRRRRRHKLALWERRRSRNRES